MDFDHAILPMHISYPTSPTSSSQTCPKWTIQPVTSVTVDKVVTFVNAARQDMFPTLHKQLPADVARWMRSGYFLAARDSTTGSIIATTGYVPYDHRFPQINCYGMRVVEVVRLYVVPEWRRAGLGAALFRALKQKAVEEGVELLYLHTHPILPGAVEFWEKKGFRVVHVDEDPVWRTTHMQLMLEK